MEKVIEVSGLNKTFKITDKPSLTIRESVMSFLKPQEYHYIHALKNINFNVRKGEFFGIIGANGSGKSTLLSIITGTIPADQGSISKVGKHIKLSLGIGANMELTARQNIYIMCSVLGMTIKYTREIIDQIIDFAELREFENTQMKYYSTGMRSRLLFAIAIHAKADIFFLDEFFGGVGDERFRVKANEVFVNTFMDGRTIVFVSHQLETIKQYCNRVLLLHKGEQIMVGKPAEVIPVYRELLHVNP